MAITPEKLQELITTATEKSFDVDLAFFKLETYWLLVWESFYKHYKDGNTVRSIPFFYDTQKGLFLCSLCEYSKAKKALEYMGWNTSKTVTEKASAGFYKVINYIYEQTITGSRVKLKWETIPNICRDLGFYNGERDLSRLRDIIKTKKSSVSSIPDNSGQNTLSINIQNLSQEELSELLKYLKDIGIDNVDDSNAA